MDQQVKQLHSRAETLIAKFKQEGGSSYIDQGIILDRQALMLCPPGHPERSVSLACLAIHLCIRYDQLGSIEDLNEAIIFDREALELCPQGHPGRSAVLHNLSHHLSTRFNQLGSVEDLNEAVALGQDALALRPPGHPDRSKSLSNLAAHLSTRYYQLGCMEDLEKAVVLEREALALRPPGHPDRSASLHGLSRHLVTRFNQLGSVEDLDEAISLCQDALALRPPGHPERSTSLSNLAAYLATRFYESGSMKDLNEAIILTQDALAIRPPGHPQRPGSLSNLAIYLYSRYEQLASLEDLNESIVLRRDVLALHPPGHPNRWISLNGLAVVLYSRYKQLGSVEDINEAIINDRDALVANPLGSPRRSLPLGNLALHLWARYKLLGLVEDLNEAIVRDREALVLRPPGNPERWLSLNNLAGQLYARHQHFGSLEDLNEAIAINRDAMALRPLGSPDHPRSLRNLATNLCSRYKQLGSMEDLDEAIVLARDALALHAPGEDPERSRTLSDLAEYLSIRFMLSSQSKDKEEMFSLYVQLEHAPPLNTTTDLSAARAWARAAEIFQHPTVPLAYKTSLRFLTHHIAVVPPLPQHLTILKRLASSLAADAFSACLRNCSLTDAVELLEQGRGVFWGQLARLQSPIDDVVASGPEGKTLADEFTRLAFHIRKVLDSPSPSQHDRACGLGIQLRKTVAKIRSLPGFDLFLLPPVFSDLRQAASQGPVIIVNSSEYGCDALIVLLDRDPVHIPLSITREGVRDLTLQLRTLTVRAKSMDVGRDFCILLRDVWNEIVSPIVESLGMTCPPRSRIWWCPTSEFTLLPLHAAGPYRKGQRNLPGLYISSYTPTLAALIRARRHHSLPHAPTAKRFVAIGQANASGVNELFSVSTELACIGQHVNNLATFTCVEGEESSIARVAKELGKNEWAHFACHGIPNRKKPFESAFALHDGRLTIDRILQCKLEDPEFAYLSACHTTVGDEESPDEVIHLASAMQFIGFRSVIGTMWAVDDGETNKITSMFYDNMKDESGCLDYTRAAFALNKTMKALVDVPFDQRILYIHLGA